jgi:hypothetical protein
MKRERRMRFMGVAIVALVGVGLARLFEGDLGRF